MTDPVEIQRYYDDYSGWYEGERSSSYYTLINNLEIDAIRKAADGARVLEIGCGPGNILEQVDEFAESAVGVDLSPKMAERARLKDLDVREASVTKLPFPDESFDVVYAFKSLPHVPDIGAAVDEIHRVLQPDGVAYLEFYNPFSLKFFANRISGLFRQSHKVYIRYDSLRQIRVLVRGRFTIVSVRGVRIFAPFRWVYTWPVFRRLFRSLEWQFCDSRVFSRFGGYLVVELRPLSFSGG